MDYLFRRRVPRFAQLTEISNADRNNNPDFFGGAKIGFIKLKAEVTNDMDEYIPGSVFVRIFECLFLIKIES